MVIAVVLLLIAMAALLVFAWVSHRAFSPLVRLTVLRSVKFRWHLLAYVLLQFVTIGYGYMIPNASQLGFGASVLAAGVVLLPGALLGAASAPVSGSLLDKFGPVRPMFTAMIVGLLGTVLMAAFIGTGSSMVMFDLWYFVYMLGFSMCFANTMTCGMAVLPPELKADGNALFNTFQQLSGAVATTVMAVFLGVAQAGHGSAGDVEFVTATQSGAHSGVCVPCSGDGVRHARQPACLRVQTIAAVLTVRELVSGSLHSLEESGQFGGVCAGRFLQWVGESGCWEAYQRINSSSGWRFQDVWRPVRGCFPPVGGGFRTVEGLWAY